MYHLISLSLVWLILWSAVATSFPRKVCADEQQKNANTSVEFAYYMQQLQSMPREKAEDVAYYGVIAAIRHGDAKALSDFMKFIPENSHNANILFTEIGHAQNRSLLDAVRSRFMKTYSDEYSRYYIQAEATDGELPSALTPDVSCKLTTLLAVAAIAADKAGHKSHATKLAQRAWKSWSSCTLAEQKEVSIIELASACARAEMWSETEKLLDSESKDYFPEFPIAVQVVARRQIKADRIKDAIANASSHLSKVDSEFVHFLMVDQLIRDGKLELAIEYSRQSKVEGVNSIISSELARTGRIAEATQFTGAPTFLTRMYWRILNAGNLLDSGMNDSTIDILTEVLTALDAIERPLSEGDATQIAGIYLLALPIALKLDETKVTERILETLPGSIANGATSSSPIQAGVGGHVIAYAKTAVVLADFGRDDDADFYFREAWRQENNSFFCRQMLVVTMATTSRFALCKELANDSAVRDLRLLAAYCEGYWKRRRFQNEIPLNSSPVTSNGGDHPLELCQRLGCIQESGTVRSSFRDSSNVRARCFMVIPLKNSGFNRATRV